MKSQLTLGLDPGAKMHHTIMHVSDFICMTLNKGDTDVVYYINSAEDVLTIMKAANELSDAWKALNEPTVGKSQQP